MDDMNKIDTYHRRFWLSYCDGRITMTNAALAEYTRRVLMTKDEAETEDAALNEWRRERSR